MKLKWIILGPGRTGSFVIVKNCVSAFKTLLNQYPSVFSPDMVYDRQKIPSIRHSHSLIDIEERDPDAQYVISCRNILESVFSWEIQPYIGYWHIMANTQQTPITPFFLDYDKVSFRYDTILSFYNLLPVLNKSTDIVIDYSEFSNDYTQLNHKLNFTHIVPLVVKNQGTHRDWILNYDEIIYMYADKITNPLEIIKSV